MRRFIAREPVASAIITVMAILILFLIALIGYQEYASLDDWKVLNKIYKGPYTSTVNVSHNNIQIPYLVRHPESFSLLLVNDRSGEVRYKYVKKEKFDKIKVNSFIKLKEKK